MTTALLEARANRKVSRPDPADTEIWDKVIVSFSGGKDSLACLLDLLDRGVPRDRIELWHQNIDGRPGGPRLMDWPVTHAYVSAVGKALGVPVLFQWKDGGFEGEMNREDAPTSGVCFQRADGTIEYLPPGRPKLSTRLQFPQVSPDLSVRWCSSYLKIDVATRALNNDARFLGRRTLFITGERRQESTKRAEYLEVEDHKSDSSRRRVLQWRSVIDWTEEQVWAIIERHGIRPHAAYYLGFGRTSCMYCIFGDPNQWHTTRLLDPQGFERVAAYERRSGKTIRRKESIVEAADRGTSTIPADAAMYRNLAMGNVFPVELVRVNRPEIWQLPVGAYKKCGGPV